MKIESASQLVNALKCFVFVAAITLVAPVAGHCDVSNGNFTAGTAGWVFTGNVGIFTSAEYDACCATGNTGTGNFAAFGGSDGPDNGHITQTIVTVPGESYLLSFDYGAFSSPAGRGTQMLTITAGGLDTTLTSALSVRDLSSVMSTYQYEFMATGDATTLNFADASQTTSSIDGFLDNVQVAPTPEPSSLFLLGTGVLGLSTLCRRQMRRFSPQD